MVGFSFVLLSGRVVESFVAFAKLVERGFQYSFFPEAHDDSAPLAAGEAIFDKQRFVGLDSNKSFCANPTRRNILLLPLGTPTSAVQGPR